MRYDHYETVGPLSVRMAGAAHDRRLPPFDATDPLPYVRSLAADPLLREAVQVASPDLANVLDRIDTGIPVSPKRLYKVALSLTRYALRHSGRTTPFGLLAGVTTARVDPAPGAEIHGPGRKAVHLDGAWLDRRLRMWLEVPSVRHRTDVVLNDLCRVHGGRLLVPAGRDEVSVRCTSLVDWVRDAAATALPYGELLDKATAAFPHTPAERIDAALLVLVRRGFLLTSLDRPDPGEATLDRIEAAVEADPQAAAELHGIRAALRSYARTPPGEGGEALRRVFRVTGTENGPAPSVPNIRVDLRMDADVRVPRAVTDEAEQYASAMSGIEWNRSAAPYLPAYRAAFLERYSTAMVTLGELVDPQRGLGFPASYRAPFADQVVPTPGSMHGDAIRARRRLITELAQEALACDGDELRLTPEVMALLTPEEPRKAGPRTVPHTLELCFQLLSESSDALAGGEFKLITSPHPGSWTAGATTGRFAELTETTDALARLMGTLDDGDTLAAQVVFRPHTPGALTALQVPRLLPHLIPVGTFSAGDEPGRLDWRRLLVSGDASGLWLTDPDTGRRVLPVVPHMVSATQAPDVARLLHDLAHGGSQAAPAWEWYGLDDDFLVLPRVTLGKVVVSPKRWLADSRLRRAAADPEVWDDAVAGWRDRHRVPERVQIARADRGFGLDLADAWHRTLLRHEVLAGGALRIVEDPTADGRGLGWAAGHSTEVVIPLVHRSPRADAPPRPGTVASFPGRTAPHRAEVRTRHLPGEEWLYAKLYAAENFHDELLGTHVPLLLHDIGAHVERWFFIRYRDPDPHLRLRFHGDARALSSRVLPELARKVRGLQDAGLVRAMTLDAYEPETDRYGGPDALPHAERLFHLDSRSALAQLAARPGASPIPDAVLAAANHALLLETVYGPDWCSWAAEAFAKGHGHTAYQRHRDLSRRLIAPGRTAAALAGRLSLPALADLWSEPAAIAACDLPLPQRDQVLHSLLHMQYVRLLGLDPEGEECGRAILRGVARDYLGRLQHTRCPAGGRGEG
ncbi:lantibiotic dehydratase [Streptomyces sp. I05A-00742]|uniref:lantibiotic dehydratase n=1 Tax=Streptomyces sp. I05A-00742 TaxID=2732853 RepID=UPI001487788A|nr:lantibiotic dehydratase [Streptomyces sp. I05A-00742]